MNKFYITSGQLKFVTTAVDQEAAAIYAVHEFISQHMDLDQIDWLGCDELELLDVLEKMSCVISQLDDSIKLSEVGFDRDDSGSFDTADIMTQWQQLLVSVAHIENQITS